MSEEAPLKVAIIGKTPSRDLAPYGDESWEIWTLSDLAAANQVPRWSRHFELHPLDWFRQRNDHLWAWLQQPHDKPIYLQELSPEVPAGVLFPKSEVLRGVPRPYFTNTVSWLLAYAGVLGASEVGVYGVDMALDEEYAHQRPSCEYFIGWLEGRGCRVDIPDRSDLCKSRRLYGFDHGGNYEKKFMDKLRELRQRHANQREKLEEAAAVARQHEYNCARLEGALDVCKYFEQAI